MLDANEFGDPSRSLSRYYAFFGWRVILSVMKSRQVTAESLSPPDPSVNYFIARDTHHEGTATWFIESSTLRIGKSLVDPWETVVTYVTR